MVEEMKLLVSWSSPFAWRVIWALNFKGIQYDLVEEDILNKSALLLQYNPFYEKVPAFVHNGKPITESLVVLEYIYETWKSNPLFPQDCYERAMARFWAKFGDAKFGVLFLDKVRARGTCNPISVELEISRRGAKRKKYFGGEPVELIDLVMGWPAICINVLVDVTGLGLITDKNFPLLFEWMALFSGSPLIKESQSLLEIYHTKGLSKEAIKLILKAKVHLGFQSCNKIWI